MKFEMLQNRYIWQAVLPNGSLLLTGGDLSTVVVVSFIPQVPSLPRHDLMGVKFVRRFCRGFVHGLGGGMKEYLHCVVCENFRLYLYSSTGMIVVTPFDYDLYL
jgi:hypothetical protein